MSDTRQFKLPDVGEGLTEAEIISWRVKPGDTVRVNDIVVQIETAKSLVELPSPYAGTVADLLVGEGETVAVGTPIIAVSSEPRTAGEVGPAPAADESPAVESPAVESPAVESPAPEAAVEPGLIGGPAPGGRTSVLVGYGPRTTEAKRRPRRTGAPGTGPSSATAHQSLQTA
ncbi:MAG: 2-oxo acid dehydrogenase subunit E2, partial [Actinomycetota bacterium]|nr:2-oxo acid dehydrogenase subunit E2 [Actinomycetota bacterium]